MKRIYLGKNLKTKWSPYRLFHDDVEFISTTDLAKWINENFKGDMDSVAFYKKLMNVISPQPPKQ